MVVYPTSEDNWNLLGSWAKGNQSLETIHKWDSASLREVLPRREYPYPSLFVPDSDQLITRELIVSVWKCGSKSRPLRSCLGK